MTATIEKTFTYDAAAVLAISSQWSGLTPAERCTKREELKARLQRDWKRGGRKGPNPALFI